MSITNEIILNKINSSLEQLVKIEAFKNKDDESWNKKNNKEKIVFLYKLNYSKEIITLLVGTTIGTVQKEISIAKKGE